jgi:hypothetical protein
MSTCSVMHILRMFSCWRLTWTASLCVILGFRREVDESCASLGYCAACGDNLLPAFRDSQSVPTFWWDRWVFPATSVGNYRYSLLKKPTIPQFSLLLLWRACIHRYVCMLSYKHLICVYVLTWTSSRRSWHDCIISQFRGYFWELLPF